MGPQRGARRRTALRTGLPVVTCAGGALHSGCHRVHSPASGRPATATLGDLYLRQGYLDEAASIYREVLRRDPDHEAASRGLETVRSRRRQWLTAEEILEDVGTELKGVTARKTELLRRYMTRLKEGAGRDVPGETS
ncbi:MAG: tetratricopeptide repeat protein [Thermoanaerobaculia bacterium]|nr:tetratricopeptide repeat protein [Thermoanaerobaculia bacterium]